MRQFEFAREPRGNVLHGLIRAATDACDRFTVELSGMYLSPHARDVQRKLEPFLIGCADVTMAPTGRMLAGDEVTLCTYRLVPEAATILRDAADHLYAWVEPDLPQDLCFLRGGDTWLINEASEEGAALLLTREEAEALQIKVPGLSLREVRASDIRAH